MLGLTCRLVEYSFASEPEFDIRANPVGRAGVFDLPTIVNGLRSFLLKASQALLEHAIAQHVAWHSPACDMA